MVTGLNILQARLVAIVVVGRTTIVGRTAKLGIIMGAVGGIGGDHLRGGLSILLLEEGFIINKFVMKFFEGNFRFPNAKSASKVLELTTNTIENMKEEVIHAYRRINESKLIGGSFDSL